MDNKLTDQSANQWLSKPLFELYAATALLLQNSQNQKQQPTNNTQQLTNLLQMERGNNNAFGNSSNFFLNQLTSLANTNGQGINNELNSRMNLAELAAAAQVAASLQQQHLQYSNQLQQVHMQQQQQTEQSKRGVL